MRVGLWFPGLMLGCALVAGLAGCTTTSSSGLRGDIVTPSDESEARRRARLRLTLASAYFEQGKTAVALDEVKQVLAIDPDLGDAHNLRGLIYMRLGEMRLAEDSFREAISLNPRDGDALHNHGWLLCQQGRYGDAYPVFSRALGNPLYEGRAKTLMAQGVCEMREGKLAAAERSLARAYELDAGNPVTGYNLSSLLYRRGELDRAQFYIRRINNSELANAESLWLGIRIERRLGNQAAVRQLADQLKRRFPESRELARYERGAFDD